MRLTHLLATPVPRHAPLLLLMLMTIAAVQAQSAFKCVEDNKTVYKDQPCAGSQGTVADDVGRKNEALAKKAEAAKKAEEASQAGREAYFENIRKIQKECGPQWQSPPAVGMIGAWVRHCSEWGAPHVVNKTTNSRGSTAQWVYPAYGYLYVNESDIVTAIQTKSRP